MPRRGICMIVSIGLVSRVSKANREQNPQSKKYVLGKIGIVLSSEMYFVHNTSAESLAIQDRAFQFGVSIAIC